MEPLFVSSSLCGGAENCVKVAAVPASYVKSSLSSPDGGTCVEVAVEPTQAVKSSLSNPNGSCVEVAVNSSDFVKSGQSINNGACVETSVTPDGCVLVCDSKDWGKPPLHCHTDLWKPFIKNIKASRYDYGQLVLQPPTTFCCPDHGAVSIVLQLDRTVRMTHSLQPDHEGHIYTPDEWRAFVGNADGPGKGGVKDGEFDLVEQDGRYHISRKLVLAATPAV